MFGRKKTRVAINGFGRIGRSFFREACKDNALEIVAINDLGEPENLAYLLKHDSVYPTFEGIVQAKEGKLLVGRRKVLLLSEKDPAHLPWKDLQIDVVLEATGVFESYAKASAHLTAGAKKVVLSAPPSDEPGGGVRGGMVLMGLNEEKLSTCDVSSNASCTTNAGSPLIAILDEKLGVEKALLNTVHAYTATQALVDSPAGKKDMRRGRAAAQNIIPASTGAAVATTKVLPSLAGKFDGIAIRVPVIAGSIVDVTFVAKRNTTAEEVNLMLEDAAEEVRWKGIFTVTREPLVSSDIVGNTHASIADLSFTRVVGGNLVKVLAWYDNEAGYAHTLVEHVREIGMYAHA
jgi:glyceraldehyde 3-phosphate dehydrogenase